MGSVMGRRFDFHPAEREWLLAERKIDLRASAAVFADPWRLDFEDTRRDYGEERRITIGWAEGRVVTLVYTFRGEVTWLITAWPSSRKERDLYARQEQN